MIFLADSSRAPGRVRRRSDSARADSGARRRASDKPLRASEPGESDLPILLVEDEPVNQRVMARVLKKLGYRPDVASDGRRALELFAEGSYALVVMDCEMPILNGYDTAREIRKREKGRRRIPIIAVTAHVLDGELEKILAAGMDDCVSKMDIETRLPERIARWYPTGVGPNSAPASGAKGSPRGAARASSRSPAIDPAVPRSEATVRVFFKHVDGQVAAVGAAIRSDDTAMLRRACHKLKGSCLVVGLPKMARLCAELEATPQRSGALFAELSRELVRVRARLKATDSKSAR